MTIGENSRTFQIFQFWSTFQAIHSFSRPVQTLFIKIQGLCSKIFSYWAKEERVDDIWGECMGIFI